MVISLPAPAKLNLFLNILNRRNDGYHNIQTVFQFIDFMDELHFSLPEKADINFHSEQLNIPPEQNLILRAANLLKEKTNTPLGAEIHLEKKLPIGGGIGGGSSNAATTLVALNQLWQTALSKEELIALGAKLGADVSIFIHGQAAYATGIGNEFSPIDLPEPWYLILMPPVSVSSAELYANPQLTRDNQPITISDFLKQGGHNSFEAIARKLYPEISDTLDWLSQFGSAKMSGSGSTVFASFDEKDQAENVLKQIPDTIKGVIAKGCNQSPLYQD